ncbi:terminase large subunit domain-containing protein [Bowmanella denitrificans]|uniref:terminase large subunit domain-containing protein n=1 Tax=Bowmanella denitrificans TaxID=366582 RepID=UPI001FE40B6C|nr:terminase family protein [Bowmanella denitrificans]
MLFLAGYYGGTLNDNSGSMAGYSSEIRDQAKRLYLQHWAMDDIKEHLNLPNVRVLYQWKEKYCWDDLLAHESPKIAIARRLTSLADKPTKDDNDFKEIEKLSAALLQLEKVETERFKRERMEQGEDGPGKKKKKRKKNDVSDITAEDLALVRNDLFYGYQQRWHDNKHQRTRFILKSRQIGATYYFAWEAFEDAVTTGDNQIFLSASRAQVMVFRAYILSFANKYFEVELKGNPIILSNDAQLHFLSTNARTAQSYHGHLYVDEVFWINDFANVWHVAKGMASHKRWRRTLFSTPSSKSHDAYTMWSGDRYNEGRKDEDKQELDTSHAALHGGHLAKDRIWRDVVTVEDAANDGCDLFDIDELKEENTPDEFDNLFMCEFVDDSHSVFKLKQLLDCATDRQHWKDFKENATRPFTNRAVWLGYDPARSRDDATLAIIAPPVLPGEKFRVLQRVYLRGKDLRQQSEEIRKIKDRYNVQHIGIDVTGIGWGVYDLVKVFYPRALALHYSPEIKTKLVLKMMDVIGEGRFEYDAGDKDIPQAFLAVKKFVTSNGQISYCAHRNAESGHGDVFFAIAHAIYKEPINYGRRKSSLSVAA